MKKKIGLITECTSRGADMKVPPYAIKRMAPEIEVIPVGLGNKSMLLTNCGNAPKNLLQKGCQYVIMAWDLYPAHSRQRPSKGIDEQKIMASLDMAGVDRDKVSLVCVVQELESWLLADRRALAKVLESQNHPLPQNFMRRVRRPDEVSNPKARLRAIFSEARGSFYSYVDHYHALEIASAAPDCKYLNNSKSFVRFAKIVQSLRKRLK